MREIKAMTKRNLLIYFRNKSAVFFSILSALILLAIMVVFLGESSSEGLLDALNQYGTGTAEENAKNASWLVQLWIMGGILGINSVTVSLTAIGSMVEDEERGRHWNVSTTQETYKCTSHSQHTTPCTSCAYKQCCQIANC